MLLLHIIIALSSVIFTGYTSFTPSKSKLQKAYLLVGLTLATGTYLLLTKPTHMVQTCITGLVYIGLVTVALVFARHRLARSENA